MDKANAFKFIFLLGIVSLFADMTYEGARSITGPFLAILGANAAVVGFVSGLGELGKSPPPQIGQSGNDPLFNQQSKTLDWLLEKQGVTKTDQNTGGTKLDVSFGQQQTGVNNSLTGIITEQQARLIRMEQAEGGRWQGIELG